MVDAARTFALISIQRSFPSSHVRENALVASHIYPSFYNGGWVVKDPELERTKDPDILDTISRSRMIGLFGFGTINGTLPERVSVSCRGAGRRPPQYSDL